ncbi:phage holin family protein [Enterococcus casseliflavus]|uniref:phage holin family protein n=1 Tax=Enterococcus casseliflavus TaxID=37734 RepID=UPI002DB99F7A|nr:phage holin family protein [Enterococcus casseliflavus]MEB6213011.1 phage holin family protein [Enterococcus casseliflavus]
MKDFIFFWGSLVSLLFGSWHLFLTILAIIQLLSLITMILNQANRGKLDSAQIKTELLGQVGNFILVILAHFIDILLFQGSSVIQNAVVLFLIGGEGLQILENLSGLGLEVPSYLAKYFRNIKDSEEQNKKEDE